MFNRTARETFDNQIRKVMEMSPRDVVGTESEISYAAGMVAYALSCEDIGHEEAALLQRRLNAARSNVVARQCAEARMART